uniref:Uncharacterized protein n=1 Tax=Rhizophora mucronata TaxID=61149 RepID=A0A2P2NTR8_RHIMU
MSFFINPCNFDKPIRVYKELHLQVYCLTKI